MFQTAKKTLKLLHIFRTDVSEHGFNYREEQFMGRRRPSPRSLPRRASGGGKWMRTLLFWAALQAWQALSEGNRCVREACVRTVCKKWRGPEGGKS